jgi:acyl-CoA reductase-like NAD-dependent aldehyde dehydrogenase
MDIFNPATGALITSIADETFESAQNKMELLKDGGTEWKAVPLKERILILHTFSAYLEEEKQSLAQTLTDETGKPLQQAINEVNGARTRIAWLCGNAEKYLTDEIMSESETMIEKISYEPLGIICNISAWNYPYLVGVNVWVPALLSGNAIMYKPSEFSTLTGLHVERLLKKAGIPENVFQVVTGGGETGGWLLDMPFDGYFFTGSWKTGQAIYQKVAKKMVVCQLEMGGKDPLYVTDEIENIESTAAGTADGAFYNNGQSCCAVERIYVHEKVYDQYVQAFLKEVKSFKTGLPTEAGVYIGALTRSGQIPVLQNQVKDAVEKGAILAAGGHKLEMAGNYFAPTVLLNVDHHMLVMTEESFGPIIGIKKVKDDAEAIALMRDTEYGLTAAVYSSNEQRAENILSELNVGTGYWNCCDRVSAALPWSGRNHSGFGATLSHAGLRAFTRPKAWHLRKK